jgi:hypothetical protein
LAVQQHIEAQNLQHLRYGTASAKSLALSFWLKSDTKTGTLCTGLHQPDGDRSYISEHTVADNNWNQYTVVIPGDSSGVIDNDNGIGLTLTITLQSGTGFEDTADNWHGSGPIYNVATSSQDNFIDNTSNNIWITGVQLQESGTNLEYPFVNFATELIRCQRYYEKSYKYSVVPGTATSYDGGVYFESSMASASQNVCFNTPKRAAPTITLYNSEDAGGSGEWYDFTASAADSTNITNASSENGFYSTNSSVTDAHEYGFQWTAEAEL